MNELFFCCSSSSLAFWQSQKAFLYKSIAWTSLRFVRWLSGWIPGCARHPHTSWLDPMGSTPRKTPSFWQVVGEIYRRSGPGGNIFSLILKALSVVKLWENVVSNNWGGGVDTLAIAIIKNGDRVKKWRRSSLSLEKVSYFDRVLE